MNQELKKALLKLDVMNPDHWTEQGVPRLDAIGIDGLKRIDVTKAAPQFTRTHPTFELPDQDDEDKVEPTDHASQVQIINMESSEYGSDDPILFEPLPVRPSKTPELQHHLGKLNEKAHLLLNARMRIVEQENVVRNEIEKCMQQLGLEVPSLVNQQRIMAFLASPMCHPNTAQKSPIDKAFEPQRDPTRVRPMLTPRDNSSES